MKSEIVDILKGLKEVNARLYIEQGKLKVDAGAGTLSDKLISSIREYKTELIFLLSAGSNAGDEIKKAPELPDYPLSYGQRRLWVLSQFEGGSVAYHMHGAIRVQKEYSYALLDDFLALSIQRHEILRTVFLRNDRGEISQRILPAAALGFTLSNVDYQNEKNKEEALKKYIAADSNSPFDLQKGPLLRMALIHLSPDSKVLYFNMHHIISDGWSMDVMLRDLQVYSSTWGKNEMLELLPLRIQYKDFAFWQLSQLDQPTMIAHKTYWLEKLSGELSVLDLPTNIVRPIIKSHNGIKLGTFIGEEITSGLQSFSQKNGGSLFMTLVALWNVLLYRYTSNKDIVLGSPIAGRDHIDLKDQIGFYVNTLTLRNQCKPEESFNSFYRTVVHNTLRAYEHQSYPFDRLVEDLGIKRDVSRSPIFDVMLGLQHDRDGYEEISEQKRTEGEISFPEETLSKVDLEITFRLVNKGLEFNIIYNPDVYENDLILGLINHFTILAKTIPNQAEKEISHIDLLTMAETNLLSSVNNTIAKCDTGKTLIDRFHEQVSRTPEGIAIVFKEKELTYRELEEISIRFSAYLKEVHGLKRGQLIAVKLKRSEKMVVAILAILELGSAYVPIDPLDPQDRLDFIVQDSNSSFLIDDHIYSDFISAKINRSFIEPCQKSLPTDIAYVIYTSGSTGRPKGCMLEHAGVVNRIDWMWNALEFNPGETVLLKTTYTFDVSVWELFLPLCWGNKMVICSEEEILDQGSLINLVDSHKINTMHFVPSALNAFISQCTDLDKNKLSSIKRLITSGEALSSSTVDKWNQISSAPLFNLYGPTEASIDVTWYKTKPNETKISIGKPIWNTQILILSEYNQLQPVGVVGELCISGIGLARGYLNRKELTAEKFTENPIVKGDRMYRTGDLARWTWSGDIEFIGRIDHQIKIRGFRVELDEISSVLEKHEKVREAVTVLHKLPTGTDQIVSYVVASDEQNAADLKSFLSQKIPNYMIPAHFVQIDKIPLKANGKVNSKLLPSPISHRLITDSEFVAPRNDQEAVICEIIAVQVNTRNERLGIYHNFFDLGLNSMGIVECAAQINLRLMTNLKPIDLFKYPTVKDLVDYILANSNKIKDILDTHITSVKRNSDTTDIAIIGLSGRFHDARNIDEFWKNLAEEKTSMKFYSRQELLAYSTSRDITENKLFVNARSIAEKREYFDHTFFGYTKEEAALMDPQIRLLHEETWLALEDGGVANAKYARRTGVYMATSEDLNWRAYAVLTSSEKVSPYLQDAISKKDQTSTLISYSLGLGGPSVHVATACSGSLSAVHMACRSLIQEECDIAVAGGAKINTSTMPGYLYQEGMIHSHDGYCRAFDKNSSGTVSGEGGAVIILKRLDDALRDSDHIYAVIKSSASNNDGDLKVGYTAPSILGQASCIKLAHALAGFEAKTIDFLEAHGTATKLGDPIEIEALNEAFKDAGMTQCPLGSVKTNIGHLDSAAGLAGLIKASLSLKHKVLPASLHFENANPEINFKGGPFYVNGKTIPIKEPKDRKLRAGVSSFGIGGTNVHVVLEQAPERIIGDFMQMPELVVFSAKSHHSLIAYENKLVDYLKAKDVSTHADIAFSVNTGRRNFQHRNYLVSESKAAFLSYPWETKKVSHFDHKGVVFSFSGQGSQFVNMGLGLYRKLQVFTEWIDRGLNLIKEKTGQDFRAVLFPQSGKETQEINQTENTQPLLFVIEYALAKQIMSWGIQPSSMIGHSVGEYTAACVAGVFTFDAAISILIKRANLMGNTAEGAMISVSISSGDLTRILDKNLSIAAVNSTSSCVVSGPVELINDLMITLDREGHEYSELKVSRAFHSALMDGILAAFEEEVSRHELHVPKIPFVSNVTGVVIKDEEATSPKYWAQHIRATVQFAKGIDFLLSTSYSLFLEVGPGTVLSHFTHTLLDEKEKINALVLNLMRHPHHVVNDYLYFLDRIGKIWRSGFELDWSKFYAGQTRVRVQVPLYEFEQNVFPVNVDPFEIFSSNPAPQLKGKDLSKYFYFPEWRRSVLSATDILDSFILFSNGPGNLIEDIAKKLTGNGKKVVVINHGVAFSKKNEESYSINLEDPIQYEKLKRALNIARTDAFVCALFWNENPPVLGSLVAAQLITSFCKGLSSANWIPSKLVLLTQSSQVVNLNDQVGFSGSMVQVIPQIFSQENQNMFFTAIDLDADDYFKYDDRLVEAVANELAMNKHDKHVAYRKGCRLVRHFSRVELTRSESSILKKNGVYIITGGLGKIPSVLAKYLVTKYDGNVILLGRRSHESAQLAFQLEGLGGSDFLQQENPKIHYYVCDVSDLKNLEQVITKVEKTHGEIHGVIHAATEKFDHEETVLPVESLTQRSFEIQFRAKAYGILNLYEVFKNRNIGFVWTTSSISSILGGVGYGAYALANSFVDSFLNARRLELRNWFYINLDGINQGNIALADIPEIFERSIRIGNYPGVVVTSRDLNLLVNSQPKKVENGSGIGQVGRPEMNIVYVAPATKLEIELTGIWQAYFDINKIGIDDNFFSLGGDSLKALTIGKIVERELNVWVKPRDFFENPTIRGLALQMETLKKLKQVKDQLIDSSKPLNETRI